jgi:hypothetical protein
MAGHAAKKAKAREESTGGTWDMVLMAVNLVYILLRVVWQWSSFDRWALAGYLFLLAVSFACKAMLVMAAGAASYGEYFLDVLVLALVVQVGSIYSDGFWYLLLLVPAFVAYQAARKMLDWVFTPTEAEVQEEEDEDDPAAQKRARRHENKMRKYA